MERMWSYLEGTPELDQRNSYVGIVCFTASLLAHRWKKASEINYIAKETLKSLVESLIHPGG